MSNIINIQNSPSVLDLVTELVYEKDLDGKYTKVNKAFLKYFNFKKSDIIGKNDLEIFSKKNAKRFIKNDKILIKSGEKSATFEEKISLRNGNDIYFESLKRIKYKKNLPVGFICISKDITLRKQYKIINELTKKFLLQISEDVSLNTIYNNAIAAIQDNIKHSVCAIVLLNNKKNKIQQVISTELSEKFKTNLLNQNINNKFCTHMFLENQLNENKFNEFHSCWTNKIFSEKKKMLGAFIIFNKKEKLSNDFEIELIETLAYLLGIAIDKVQKEKKIKEKESLLIQQSKMASLGEMLENIAHQWRQPLSVILTGITTIKLNKEMKIYNEECIDDLIERIISSSQYLSNTIDDFRNFFVKDKTLKEFTLNELFAKVESITSHNLTKNCVNLVKDIQDINLITLENELLHALLNIINNAIDAHKTSKHNQKYLFIRAKKVRKQLKIEILDNANGIKDDILEKVFEPYFSTKHKSQGTGIGLYMTREIITKHLKGFINVKNESFTYNEQDYKGAKFTIYLPCKTQ